MMTLEPPAQVARMQVHPSARTTGASRDALSQRPGRAECRWGKCLASIESLRGLAHDWDGEGAKPPAHDLIDSAADLLRLLRRMATEGMPPPSAVAPGSDGTVFLAWHRGEQRFEIELAGPGEAEWYRSEPGRASEGGETLAGSLRALIDWAAR